MKVLSYFFDILTRGGARVFPVSMFSTSGFRKKLVWGGIRKWKNWRSISSESTLCIPEISSKSVSIKCNGSESSNFYPSSPTLFSWASKIKTIFSEYLAWNSIFIGIWDVCHLLFYHCILFYRKKMQKVAKSIMIHNSWIILICSLFKYHRKNHKIHWLSCHSNNLRHLVVEYLHIRSFHRRPIVNLANRHSGRRCSSICWTDSVIKSKLNRN